MDKIDHIVVTGGSGMVGRALVKQLKKNAHTRVTVPTHAELDCRDQKKVRDYFEATRPHYVFHLAAIVGGIEANARYPGEFIYDNTLMQANVIDAAYRSGVKKLLFPGSACTYPKLAPQPIQENSFLSGPIEPTNVAYAAAKIQGIIMCQSYRKQYGFPCIVPMPTNAYGINDNFDPARSHVIPALMQRFHQAKCEKQAEVVLWGTGQVLREFIYVDDLADALIFLMQHYDEEAIINLGTGEEITILELAKQIATVVGYRGKIVCNTTLPDGAPRKCLAVDRLFQLGWRPKVSLSEGLTRMYQFHFANAELGSAVC